jgi:HEAT repeat protein
MSKSVRLSVISALTVAACAATAIAASAQPAKFEDVVRNLRNPDAKIRVSAVRLLREAGYSEAIAPMAALVNDPVNEIQLEAIDAELSFYLVAPVPAKKRVALVVEVRTEGRAPAAFELGPLAAWPKPVPSELVDALLQAVDDDNGKVRVEAIYTLGVIGRAPLSDAANSRLIKALDHYDPSIRAGAARVIGRLLVKSAGDGLLKAVNDSNAQVRYASIRALGEIGEERAIQAITDQFNYYQRGEGAAASLDALARIAHASSVPLFQARLDDKDPYIRRAAVEGLARAQNTDAAVAGLETIQSQDDSEMVRAANAFALYKHGQKLALGRLIDMLDSDRVAPQIQGYLLELGPSVVTPVLPRLNEPDEGVRRNLAAVLGALGDQSTVPALTPLKDDRDRQVAAAATHAIERIKMTQK